MKRKSLIDARFEIEPDELEYVFKQNPNQLEFILKDWESEARSILKGASLPTNIEDLIYETRYHNPAVPSILSTKDKTAYAAHILIGAFSLRDAITSKDAKRAAIEMFKLCVNAARINILETAEARIRGAQRGGRHPKEKMGIQVALEKLILKFPKATAKELWGYFKKNHPDNGKRFYVESIGSEIHYDQNRQRLVETNIFNKTVTQSIGFKTLQKYFSEIKNSFKQSQ